MSAAIGSNDSTYGAYGGGVAAELTGQSNQIKTQMDKLLEQASTGIVSQTYAGLGANASISLSVEPEIAQQQAYNDNINAASTQMQVTQTALSQISSIASTFYADCDSLNSVDPTAMDNVASNAQQALQEVASLLDSTDGSNYVFAGTDSATAPITDPNSILTSGYYTSIQSAVANLATSGAASVISQTLGIAQSNAAGVSPFSASQSQPAATVNAQLPQIETGDGQETTVGISASANAFVASSGTTTSGSYIRDIMSSLATLGSLSSSQINTTGFAALVGNVYTTLGNAITALNQDAGVLGTTQSNLTAQQTTLTATTTALQSQVANVQNANMTTTLSQLTQTQTQLQASYQCIEGYNSMSLVKYLPTPSS
jgi:flagellar hook-associated protein 3 FlgL